MQMVFPHPVSFDGRKHLRHLPHTARRAHDSIQTGRTRPAQAQLCRDPSMTDLSDLNACVDPLDACLDEVPDEALPESCPDLSPLRPPLTANEVQLQLWLARV